MRLLCLLFLGLLAGSFAQNPPLVAAPPEPVASVFSYFDVVGIASGELSLYAVVKFVPGIDLVASLHTIVINFVAVRGTIVVGQTSSALTSLFVPSLALFTFNNSVVLPTTVSANAGNDLADIYFIPGFGANTISTIPISFLGWLSPFGRALTSVTGNTLLVNLQFRGRLKAGVEYLMIIPQRILAPNFPCPQQMVLTSLGYLLTSQILVPLPQTNSLLDYLLSPIEAAVALTYTCPWIGLSSLLVHSCVADTSIQGKQILTFTVTFTLGVVVIGGNYIAIEVDQAIFADVPTTNGANIVSLGFNCAAFPELCCSASQLVVRRQTPSAAGATFYPIYGWNLARIKLGPVGCILPMDKVIVLVFTSLYMGKLPTIALTWNLNSIPYTPGVAIALNCRMWTTSEPTPRNALYLGESSIISNGLAVTIITAGNIASFTPAWLFNYEIISWSAFVIGYSTVKGLVVEVSTVVVNAVIEWVKITFVLSTVGILNFTAATVNAFLITFTVGVLVPNYGTIASPNTLLDGSKPADCTSMRAFTNVYASLGVLMNPLFSPRGITDAARNCAAALREGSTIVLVLGTEYFNRQLAAGTQVYIWIRAIDPFMDNSLKLFRYFFVAGWTGPAIASVDTAVLAMVAAWFTVASCSAGTVYAYEPTVLTDIYAMSVETRCLLVSAIAMISPVTAGFLQCPNAAVAANANNMVSFVKVAEATLTWALWPWAWIGNIIWPILVSMPGTVEVRILNFGWIIDSPMFAVVVSYPAVATSLKSLGITPSVPATWTLLLIIRMDRMTESCQTLIFNPWEFMVITNKQIVQCLVFPSDGSNLAGKAVEGVMWGSRIFVVGSDGVVVCWTAVNVSPKPGDDGSDNALFGLLALIAAPILLCYCLLALLWFLRPKREPPCCVPECPVQEMYWVSAQQPAPVYMVEQACCAPCTTPMYLVQ